MGSPLPEHYPDLSAPVSDMAPCVGCGLCCDGTMFERVRAEAEEEQRILNSGLSLDEEKGIRYFPLPCPHSVGGRCGIYEGRFTKCRTFRCKLLKAYHDGKIDIREAAEKIGNALKLRDAVAAQEPEAVLLTERIRIRRQANFAKERSKLLLHMAALDYYLDVHFRNKNPQVVQAQDETERT
jgi:hypothetical protein